jgi:hypothetical protein
VQTVNAIGTKRKDHKYSILLGRICNLPPHLRDEFDRLLLMAICNVKKLKGKGGVCRMFAGAHA